MSHRFDAIIIGTGQAGPALAARLSGAGMKVAVIERDKFGGTCVNDGCTPTKTMVASAYAAHLARRAGDFGVAVNGSIAVDMTRVKARKDAISGESSAGVESGLRQTDGSAIDVPVQRGRELPRPDMPDALEILSGLKSGDGLVQP